MEPLIRAETVDRELYAVDSEHKKNLQMDRRRLQQLDRSTVNPQHPWNHFSTGSLKTLKEDPTSRNINIRDAIFEYFTKYYSANQMKLCVLGREPVDLLGGLGCGLVLWYPEQETETSQLVAHITNHSG